MLCLEEGTQGKGRRLRREDGTRFAREACRSKLRLEIFPTVPRLTRFREGEDKKETDCTLEKNIFGMASRVVCRSNAVASRRTTGGGIRSRITTSRRRSSFCRRVLDKPSEEGSAVLDDEEIVDELKQMKQEKLERAGKYRAKVAGTETPEWNYVRVVENREIFPKLRELVLEVRRRNFFGPLLVERVRLTRVY